jgi:hypothetical protein
MVYWFAGFPTQPECFPYSRQQFQADQAYLCSLIQEIAALPEEGFLETGGAEMDRFCLYGSLCDRGVEAGLADDLSEDGDLAGTDFDFEQVIEIEY